MIKYGIFTTFKLRFYCVEFKIYSVFIKHNHKLIN